MIKINVRKAAVMGLLLMGMVAEAFSQNEISFDHYLKKVKKQNLEYLASCLNVDIADAEMTAAKVLPDPSVEFEAGRENYAIGLSWSLELAKKKARVQVARSEKEYEGLALENSFHDLRAQAAELFLNAILQRELLTVKKSSYAYMSQLSESDSLRFLAGEINEIDARQSRLERISLLNDVFEQEAAYRSALVDLNRFMGVDSDTLLIPTGNWKELERDFRLQELLDYGMSNRTEIQMALKNIEISEKAYKLARAERRPDIDLSVSYERDWRKLMPENGYGAVGISVPLSFSAINKGTVKSARLRTAQANIEHKDAELQVCAEIRQAWFSYQAECSKVDQYRSGIMEESRKVLDGMVYKYQRGEASVLDVLISQRSYNEVCLDYLDTMKGYVSSLVALERSCGFWDIHF